jgi:hypothetical protein
MRSFFVKNRLSFEEGTVPYIINERHNKRGDRGIGRQEGRKAGRSNGEYRPLGNTKSE